MNIVTIGLSHKTAPLRIREKIDFSDVNAENSYILLKAYPDIKEAFILSTCNRVELYGVGYDEKKVKEALKDFLYKSHEIMNHDLEEYLYEKTGPEAIRHLARVAAGLDSMIIGESQILGQIKRSYERANEAGFIGMRLHRLLQDAIRIGKKVRTLTDISKGVTSLPGAAIELIKKQKHIAGEKVLVIGAGKIGRMTVSRLSSCGIKEVVVINRENTKLEDIKKTHNVRAENFDALRRELSRADIVITATSAVKYIITHDMVRDIFKKKSEILLIDLGVPRNIEDSVKDIKGVRLYNVDDLGCIIDDTILTRELEAGKAEALISGLNLAQGLKGQCKRLSLV